MFKTKASPRPRSEPAGADWAVHEFGLARLPDQRLVGRLLTISSDFARQPTASIPQACGSWAKTKAAYRFFDHATMKSQDLLSPHTEATLARMQEHKIVLCVQDTTSLNYSTHRQTRGLGPIGGNRDKTIGLFLHSTLALTPEGQPLGLLQARSWTRSAEKFGRCSQERNRLPVAEKESQKWIESLTACQTLAPLCPKTTLVNLADREGDIYELFAQALDPAVAAPAHLLVRAQHNRQVNHRQKCLWDFLAARPVGASLKVQVPRQDGRPGRLATLSIRYGQVTLCPPGLKEYLAPLTLWAVEARETRPPKEAKPICWRLLTTLPVTSPELAVEKVRWYTQRWVIEVLHKVLKSGCQIEQRQLETVERLQLVLMVDLIVAWRVLALCRAGRQTPAASCSHWLNADQWRALWCYIHRRNQPPQRAPGVRQAVRWIAQLGGFLARARDGEPGPIVLWRGLQQLHSITASWKIFGHK